MRAIRCAIVAVALLAIGACGEAAPTAASSTSAPSSRSDTPEPSDSLEAQEYRTLATVLEEGDGGPQLCHSVAESYPPQCSGPKIVGWDWDTVDGEESANGVTWVDATLTGTWDGDRFTVTRPVEGMSARHDPAADDPATSAPGCDDPDVVDASHRRNEVDAVIEPLEQAGVSSIRVSDPSGPWDGPFVLTVLVPPGRGDEITALIRQDYRGALCVVERDLPTIDELSALQDEISAALANDDGSPRDTPLGPQLGSVPDTERGVVLLQVIAATDEARAWAWDHWGDRVVLDPMLRPVR